MLGTLTETVRARDTAGDLLGRLATAGSGLLVATLDALEDGSLVANPAARRRREPRARHRMPRVRWEHPALATDRRVRAVTPSPGAWTTAGDRTRVKLGPVRLRPDVTDLPGGSRAGIEDEVLVGTGTHAVQLGDVAPAGRAA